MKIWKRAILGGPALAGVMLALLAASAAAQEITPVAADFLLSPGDRPPPADTPDWQARAIPDDWDRSQPGRGGNGWYRFIVDLPRAPDEPWAVHVKRQRMTASVYVNGSPLGAQGRFDEPVARNWNRPLYFVIPQELLHAGRNVVHVRVQGDPNLHAGLFGLELGPDAQLRARWETRHFWKVTVNQALFALTCAMAALMGLFWLRRRRERVYGWFALTALVWAANSTHFFVRDLPLSTRTWEWFGQTSTDLFAVLMAICMHRWLDLRRPRVEHAMLAYAATSAAVLALVPLERMFATANLMHSGAVLVVGYSIALMLREGLRRRHADTLILGAALATQGLLGAHDWVLQMGLMEQSNWYLLHYGAPLLLAAFAWLLTSRFIQTLDESQTLNAELEQRVEAKRRELAASFARQQILERERIVTEERERLFRDLHDGLGGQLVSALALAQAGHETAIEQTLREALDDLRLVIDSLDPDEHDLPVLLGTVRARLEPRMARAGLRFEWQVRDVPALPGFGPDKALQVLRIVQEAVANILKHAQAQTITVRTGTRASPQEQAPGVFIEVIDDGVGIAAAHVGGRGLSNMRSRAQRIGARLDLDSDASGTAVRLWLPLVA